VTSSSWSLAAERAPAGDSGSGDMTKSDVAPDEASADERFAEFRRTRSRALRNALIQEHMGLAEALAHRYSHRGEPIEDLCQVAMVGLLKAVERFEPARGVRFTSFATPTILGELKRHFRDRGWAVRVPRAVQETHLRLRQTAAALHQELGRAPSTSELAERLDITDEAVLEATEAGGLYRLASLDAPAPSGDPDARAGGDHDPGLLNVENRVAVERLLSRLPARERSIIELRFFAGLTQAEIAERIGISQMHVSRLLARSLGALGEQADAVLDPSS
jgi:RNA polymerase sigma-B factor